MMTMLHVWGERWRKMVRKEAERMMGGHSGGVSAARSHGEDLSSEVHHGDASWTQNRADELGETSGKEEETVPAISGTFSRPSIVCLSCSSRPIVLLMLLLETKVKSAADLTNRCSRERFSSVTCCRASFTFCVTVSVDDFFRDGPHVVHCQQSKTKLWAGMKTQ